MEILSNRTTREARFERMLVTHSKAYGNRIYKERFTEYFKDKKAEKYDTPYLSLRQKHRQNANRLTKDQKRQEINYVGKRRVKNQLKVIQDYISAYPSDAVPVTSQALLSTMKAMNEEGQKMFE